MKGYIEIDDMDKYNNDIQKQIWFLLNKVIINDNKEAEVSFDRAELLINKGFNLLRVQNVEI